MNKIVGTEFYCRNCGYTKRGRNDLYTCPQCGSDDVYNSNYITCKCGTTVYLDSRMNRCEGCGKIYRHNVGC